MKLDEQLMTPQQIADYLQVQLMTIYKWSSQGRIPCFKISGRCVRFKKDKVIQWLATKEQKGRKTRRVEAS